MRVVLLGLTGMANPVLRALLETPGVEVAAVFTESYANAYPFYPERQVLEVCAERGVTCHADVRVSRDSGFPLLEAARPDVILVATFKQILKARVIDLPRLGTVNLHPSLLPRLRGPCPIQGALLQGERRTGVTAHFMTEEVDRGDVLLQRGLDVGEDDDGALRRRLALLAGGMVPEVLGLLQTPGGPPRIPQDDLRATAAPRPAPELAWLEDAPDAGHLLRRFRAFHPFPGASWLWKGERREVGGVELLPGTSEAGIRETDTGLEVGLSGTTARILWKR